jgi:dolichol kinase
MRTVKDAGSLAGPIAVAVVAVVCCAALPAVAGVFTGLTLATIFGVGAGLIAVLAAVAGVALFLRARRRRYTPRRLSQ